MSFLNSFYLPFTLLAIPIGLCLAGYVFGKLAERANNDPYSSGRQFLYGACWGSILTLAIVATR